MTSFLTYAKYLVIYQPVSDMITYVLGAAPPAGLIVGNAKIETAVENLQQQSLDATELREYCQKRFQFKNINIIRFK